MKIKRGIQSDHSLLETQIVVIHVISQFAPINQNGQLVPFIKS